MTGNDFEPMADAQVAHLIVCKRCGALVWKAYLERHEAAHEGLDALSEAARD
jgi:hypothetical protein